jgi:hypothetical protein
MALTTAGAVFAAKAITGLNSPTLFSASNYYLGVGDNNGSTVNNFAVGQTDLQAASNKGRKQVTSVAESAGVVTAVASWDTASGNWEWIEWGSFNASSGGTMLQRKVESPSLGTKTSAQVWSLTATLTFAAA